MKARQTELFASTGVTINPNDYLTRTQALLDIISDDLRKWMNTLDSNNYQFKQSIIDYKLPILKPKSCAISTIQKYNWLSKITIT